MARRRPSWSARSTATANRAICLRQYVCLCSITLEPLPKARVLHPRVTHLSLLLPKQSMFDLPERLRDILCANFPIDEFFRRRSSASDHCFRFDDLILLPGARWKRRLLLSNPAVQRPELRRAYRDDDRPARADASKVSLSFWRFSLQGVLV